jgi:hypothetical protein
MLALLRASSPTPSWARGPLRAAATHCGVHAPSPCGCTLTWPGRPSPAAPQAAPPRRAEPGYARPCERFGRYAQPGGAEPGGPLVWMHAVSLGETRAAAILLDALRASCPACACC